MSKQQASSMMKNRPSRLSMEGYIYNADKVLDVALHPQTHKAETQKLLQECVGVAILSCVHAGALITAHYGTGVLMAKKKTTSDKIEWSAPSAVMTVGYSMGALAGGKVDSVLIFIMNDETLRDFMTKPQTRMGLDVALAAGRRGGTANVGLEAESKGTVSVALTNGAFVGASIQIGTLEPQHVQNERFYSISKLTAKTILMSSNIAEVPPESQVPDLHRKLNLLADGLTWVPSPEDVDRSSHFLKQAEDASRHFVQVDLQ
ncbi:LAS seventeen-binding protein 3 [Seminavis robusta]|uniref:LAS seventeen-binding protein 3 n=1 Tax=Seminavis robusta TaxID=568900 RepID=A0A9N8EZ97_9STRA|nr:LAS seventeen-binding protein 3 [Seminavis robusta]|eukprot:Sro2064_g313150.1 LAS seventeen-binding protein 3 (261) ;mRNA; r:8159-8941